MAAATGDLKNNICKVQTDLRSLHYGGPFDVFGVSLVNVLNGATRRLPPLVQSIDFTFGSITKGEPAAFLPLIHYVLLDWSPHLASHIAKKGHDLYGKRDTRFVESVYRLLRDEFGYRPSLTRDQFFSMGFAERKLIFIGDLVRMCRTLCSREGFAVNASTLTANARSTTLTTTTTTTTTTAVQSSGSGSTQHHHHLSRSLNSSAPRKQALSPVVNQQHQLAQNVPAEFHHNQHPPQPQPQPQPINFGMTGSGSGSVGALGFSGSGFNGINEKRASNQVTNSNNNHNANLTNGSSNNSNYGNGNTVNYGNGIGKENAYVSPRLAHANSSRQPRQHTSTGGTIVPSGSGGPPIQIDRFLSSSPIRGMPNGMGSSAGSSGGANPLRLGEHSSGLLNAAPLSARGSGLNLQPPGSTLQNITNTSAAPHTQQQQSFSQIYNSVGGGVISNVFDNPSSLQHDYYLNQGNQYSSHQHQIQRQEQHNLAPPISNHHANSTLIDTDSIVNHPPSRFLATSAWTKQVATSMGGAFRSVPGAARSGQPVLPHVVKVVDVELESICNDREDAPSFHGLTRPSAEFPSSFAAVNENEVSVVLEAAAAAPVPAAPPAFIPQSPDGLSESKGAGNGKRVQPVWRPVSVADSTSGHGIGVGRDEGAGFSLIRQLGAGRVNGHDDDDFNGMNTREGILQFDELGGGPGGGGSVSAFNPRRSILKKPGGGGGHAGTVISAPSSASGAAGSQADSFRAITSGGLGGIPILSLSPQRKFRIIGPPSTNTGGGGVVLQDNTFQRLTPDLHGTPAVGVGGANKGATLRSSLLGGPRSVVASNNSMANNQSLPSPAPASGDLISPQRRYDTLYETRLERARQAIAGAPEPAGLAVISGSSGGVFKGFEARTTLRDVSVGGSGSIVVGVGDAVAGGCCKPPPDAPNGGTSVGDSNIFDYRALMDELVRLSDYVRTLVGGQDDVKQDLAFLVSRFQSLEGIVQLAIEKFPTAEGPAADPAPRLVDSFDKNDTDTFVKLLESKMTLTTEFVRQHTTRRPSISSR